jgi:hypothetical protein
MDFYFNPFVDRRPIAGSILPVTPYEKWQFEKYQNFLPEYSKESFNQKPNKDGKIETRPKENTGRSAREISIGIS